jgi:hypothetical protein
MKLTARARSGIRFKWNGKQTEQVAAATLPGMGLSRRGIVR